MTTLTPNTYKLNYNVTAEKLLLNGFIKGHDYRLKRSLYDYYGTGNVRHMLISLNIKISADLRDIEILVLDENFMTPYFAFDLVDDGRNIVKSIVTKKYNYILNNLERKDILYRVRYETT